MYIALNGTLVRSEKLSWEEYVAVAAKTGFGGVSVYLDTAMEQGVEATRELLSKNNLKPSVIGLPVNFREDDQKFRESIKNLSEAAEFGVAIDCPRFATWLLPAYDTPSQEMDRILGERLGASAEVLARQKIRFGLEFVSPWHHRTAKKYLWRYRMDEMLEFAEICGPNVGLLLDSWHWHHAQGSVADILAAGKEKIVHVQVADSADLPEEEIRDFERLMPGEGVVDLNGFFGALKKIGYEDGLGPEIFGRGLDKTPPADGAALGLFWTQKTMRRAGIQV